MLICNTHHLLATQIARLTPTTARTAAIELAKLRSTLTILTSTRVCHRTSVSKMYKGPAQTTYALVGSIMVYSTSLFIIVHA
jgi:hypothetical protein